MAQHVSRELRFARRRRNGWAKRTLSYDLLSRLADRRAVSTRLASSDASLVTGGDGGNRTRVREIRPRTSTSLVGRFRLVQAVAADRATSKTSRWEPKLPLEHSYRRRSAARRYFDARPPVYRRETGADAIACAIGFVPRTGLGCQWRSRDRGLRDRDPSVLFGTLDLCSVVNGARAPRLAVHSQPSPSKPVIPVAAQL